MANAVDYVNRALSLLGAETITALDYADSPNAATAKDLYDPTVDELLMEWPWRFAVGRESLSKLTTTPLNTDFEYEYALPADLLRIVTTDVEDGQWMLYRDPESGYRRLYANQDGVKADMVRRPDDSLFPPHFQRALVHRLAMVLAMPVTRKPEFFSLYAGMAASAIQQAKAQDWNEQPWPEMDDGNLLINARNGGTGY
jgi:hypothetical protein